MNMNEKLAVIIPVYNESEIVSVVINNWNEKLQKMNIDFNMFVYDDGSTDETYKIITKLSKDNKNIIAIHKKNEGHGPTISKAYKQISSSNSFDWIFQIDSDNELRCDNFEKLWDKRQKYDFLLGQRQERNQQWPRKILSFMSRVAVHFIFGKGIYDVNSPYRLMRVKSLQKCFSMIPANSFAPNVLIVSYVNHFNIPLYEYPIHHTNRTTGKASLKSLKLFSAAFVSFVQIIYFRYILAKSNNIA